MSFPVLCCRVVAKILVDKTFLIISFVNVRGKRNRLGKVSYLATDYNGDIYFLNRDAKEYLNVHYHYIENMMNTVILDQLALEFNMKVGRTKLTSLQEDYEALSIVDIINSMVED